jgi:hypothetical protein
LKKIKIKTKEWLILVFAKTINKEPAVLMKEEPTMNWRFYAQLFGLKFFENCDYIPKYSL